jgi:hypothetical protein
MTGTADNRNMRERAPPCGCSGLHRSSPLSPWARCVLFAERCAGSARCWRSGLLLTVGYSEYSHRATSVRRWAASSLPQRAVRPAVNRANRSIESNRGCSGDKVQSIYSFTRHGRSGRSIACLWDGCAGRFRVRPYNRMGWAGACRYVEVDAALRLGWLVDEKDQDGNTILHWAYRPTHTTRTHAHIRMHTHTYAFMHALMHARPHAYAPTRMRTCGHTDTPSRCGSSVTAFRNRTASR